MLEMVLDRTYAMFVALPSQVQRLGFTGASFFADESKALSRKQTNLVDLQSPVVASRSA